MEPQTGFQNLWKGSRMSTKKPKIGRRVPSVQGEKMKNLEKLLSELPPDRLVAFNEWLYDQVENETSGDTPHPELHAAQIIELLETIHRQLLPSKLEFVQNRTETITVRIPKNLYDASKHLADANNLTLSDLIASLLWKATGSREDLLRESE